MPDANQIRINELARELEVKARAILDYLPEAGVTEKKTHSSSIDVSAAEKVKKHFQSLAQAEADAEAAAISEKAAKDAAAKAAKRGVPVAAAPTAAAPAPAKPAPPVAAPAAPVAPHVPAPVAAPPTPAPIVEAKPAAPVAAKPAAAPVAPATPHVPAAPAAKAPIAARPPAAPARPTAPQRSSTNPATRTPISGPKPPVPGPTTNRPPITHIPSGPVRGMPLHTQRPGAPGSMRSGQPAGRPVPGRPIGGSRPGAPGTVPGRYPSRPGAPPTGPGGRPPMRPGQRPTGPGGAPPVGKAEPGKPIYERKPASRARPTMDRRFEEGERKLHPVRARPGVGGARAARPEAPPPVERPRREITITEGVTVRELAEKLDVRAKDLLKVLLDKGVFASINQALDTPTATTLAEGFNGVVSVVTFEEEAILDVAETEKPENLVPRPPVVTVMGHVDHGKTSLLDAIRETDVAGGEAGGITQHIGAYSVNVHGRKVVFIDTPGHEAFTRMRARGAKVTDIVVLVVAADDGVMPQTAEAIDHSKAAKVPIIVAVNKMDKPGAESEKIKRQLSERGLMSEEWGGDTIVVEVSAKLKKNLDKLLEMILLVADMRELKANPGAVASGTVLESRVDRGRGPVATVLVQNGTLSTGDFFLCGAVFGKVRAMFDDKGQPVKSAGPSTPVEVLGLEGIPEAGDQFHVTDEAKARHLVEFRQSKIREATLARTAGARLTLDQLHEQLAAGDVKELPLIIKADVQGSVEVLSEMLPTLSTDQVKLKILSAGVGAVRETDVLLASASGAVIIAFNVRPERKAAELAQREHVDIRHHSIIYEVSDEIKKAMLGLLDPVFQETVIGHAEVRNVFKIKGTGAIAGCFVVDGILKRNAQVRVMRDGAVAYTGQLSSLKRFKEDVGEVRTGFECGASISNFNDVKVGDTLECFTSVRVAHAEATA
jgi:translation initiation factor IF-2